MSVKGLEQQLMQFDAATIERMVQDVLRQLQPSSSTPATPVTPAKLLSVPTQQTINFPTPTAADVVPQKMGQPASPSQVVLSDRVITADLLKEKAKPASQIVIGVKSLITPAAQDFLKLNRITWERGTSSPTALTAKSISWRILGSSVSEAAKKAVTAICQQRPQVKFELVGTATEAAKSAVAAISRGEVPGVIILTSAANVVACKVNRNQSIRAAIVSDLKSWNAAETTLYPNVACIDAADRSYMELQNILNRIVSKPPSEAPAGWDEI
jgi:phage host-nuclease inhibitor protein Gam